MSSRMPVARESDRPRRQNHPTDIRNEALWDRTLRVLLGIAPLYLGWSGVLAGGWSMALKVIGFIPLVTGLAGWCPIYALARIRTSGNDR